MKLIAALIIVAVIPVVAQAEVVVTKPWARASVLASRPGAAYMTVVSDTDDRLVEIKTPVAGHVMLHRLETDPAGVNRMVHLETLDLSANAPVTLGPGGMHLMLMNLSTKLQEGEKFQMTLFFETAGEVTVEVPVRGPGAINSQDDTP